MQIYDNDNNLIIDTDVDDTSVRFKQIMGDNNLTLKFSLNEFVDVPLGAWCDFKAERYILFTPESFVMNHSEHFDYNIVFESWQAYLRFVNFKFFVVIRNPGEADKIQGATKSRFDLTGSPADFAQLLVDNLNFGDPSGDWKVGECIESEPITIDFNKEFCNQALQKIADRFNTEWEFENKTLHLRKVEKMKDSPVRLSYGYNNGILGGISRKQYDDSRVLNRVYIDGSDRNINQSTYGNDTLLMSKNQIFEYEGIMYRTDQSGSYVERVDRKGLISEDTLDVTKIYPRRVGTVSRVIEVDDSKGFYDFTDESIPESLDFDKLVIPGETLIVTFQTGVIPGKDFEAKYHHADRRFALKPIDNQGLIYPKGSLIPEVGNKYAVFKISLPQEYIDSAQEEAKIEAVKFLYEGSFPKFTYEWKLDGIYAKRNWGAIGGYLSPGYFVEFDNPDFLPEPVNIRIISVTEYVNKPKSPTIEISNNITGKSIGAILNEIPTQEQATERKDKEVREYAKRRWRDSQELIDSIMGMSDEFKENLYSALVFEGMIFRAGAASLQYRFLADDWQTTIEADLYYNKTEKRFYCPASKIIHETIEIGDVKPYWIIPEYRTDALTESKTPYYLYLKCSKQLSTIDGRLTGEGSFFISDQKIKIEDQEGYYTFWVALINSENEENDRSFTRMYGFSELLPGQLTVDTWRTADGLSYIKGLANQARIGDHIRAIEWNIIKGLLQIINADIELRNEIGEIVAKINGSTGDSMFGKGLHLFNADGSLSLADNNIVWDLLQGLLVRGRFESNRDQNRIIIDPEERALILRDKYGNDAGKLYFDSSSNGNYSASLVLKGQSTGAFGDTTSIIQSGGIRMYSLSTGHRGYYGTGKLDIESETAGFHADCTGNSGKLRIYSEGMPEDRINLSSKDWYIDYPDEESDGYIRVRR